MIVDRLENRNLYQGLDPRWVRALQFLAESDVANLSLGRHDIDGDRLFALVQEYDTKPTDECRWEAHRRYCDVQFVARGVERIGVANLQRMKVTEPYDSDRDVGFFSGDGDFITLPAGAFAIFAPEDVHMPCTLASKPELVRKIVVKALIENA